MQTTPARGSHPLEDLLLLDPRRTMPRCRLGLPLDRREDPGARLEHPSGHLLIDRGAADQDLLLGGEQGLGQLGVAAGDPAHAQSREAVGLRHGRDAERALGERGRHRQGLEVGELAVRLVDEERAWPWLSTISTTRSSSSRRDHRPRRVVRVRDADQPRVRSKEASQPVRIERPSLLEGQLEQVDLAAQGPGRLQVGRVVGRCDDGVPALAQQRCRDREEGRRRPGGGDHVVGAEARSVGGDQLTQPRQPAVVPVLEEEAGHVAVDPMVGEAHVGERALREVVGDLAVAQLLGRLDLDRHPPVSHR